MAETPGRLDKAVEDTSAKLTPLHTALTKLEVTPLDATLAEATVTRLDEAKENRRSEIANLEKDIAVLGERLRMRPMTGWRKPAQKSLGNLRPQDRMCIATARNCWRFNASRLHSIKPTLVSKSGILNL